MAKRTHRSPAQAGKDNTGFVRAFFSLLNFREGHGTPKLLKNENHGKGGGHPRVNLDFLDCPNDKHDKVIYDNSRSERVNTGKVSVKELIEEEMSHEILKKNISKSRIQLTVSDYENETNLRKNHKQRSKKFKVTSDVNIDNLTAPTSLGKPFPNTDLAAFLAQFYNYTNKNQEMQMYSSNMVSLSSALRAICDKMHNHLDESDSLLDQKQLRVRNALIDVAEAISSQVSIEKQLVGRRRIQSQELVDALEVLHSNKDLLLKLVIDPESLLLENAKDFQDSYVAKHSKVEGRFSEKIQVLEEEDNVNSENHEESNSITLFNPRKSTPFWKKNGPKEAKFSTETHSSQDLNRIVVLKPNMPRNQNPSIMKVTSSSPHSYHYPKHEKEEKRVVSFFSLIEIKRKLKRMFFENRKEQNAVSMDGAFHRIPVEHKDPMDVKKESANEAVLMSSTKIKIHNNEKVSDTLVSSSGKNKNTSPGECALNINDNVVSNTAGYSIYQEAKRHLIEMLDAGVQTDSPPTERITKSLGKLLFLPEYSLSPISSPRRQAELCLSPKKTGFSTSEQMTIDDTTVILRQNLEATSCFSNNLNSGDTLKTENEDTRMHHISDTARELMSAGIPEIVEEEDINIKQIPELLDAIISRPEIEEPDTESNRTNEEIVPPSASGFSDDNSRWTIPSEMSPRLSATEKSFPAESIIEKPERSPVSVLEPFSMEDRLQIQPQKAEFQDGDNSSRVLTVLNTESNLRNPIDDNKARSRSDESGFEGSGSNGNECLERYNLADQLLELSMICEEGSSWYLLRDDRKLLLDCIDEVLIKIEKKCSKCTSSLSFIKSSTQTPLRGKHLVHEVHKWFEGLAPNTLEEVVKKDLNSGSWMDLGIEADDLSIKICDAVLDYLMEESLVDFSGWTHFT